MEVEAAHGLYAAFADKHDLLVSSGDPVIAHQPAIDGILLSAVERSVQRDIGSISEGIRGRQQLKTYYGALRRPCWRRRSSTSAGMP